MKKILFAITMFSSIAIAHAQTPELDSHFKCSEVVKGYTGLVADTV